MLINITNVELLSKSLTRNRLKQNKINNNPNKTLGIPLLEINEPDIQIKAVKILAIITVSHNISGLTNSFCDRFRYAKINSKVLDIPKKIIGSFRGLLRKNSAVSAAAENTIKLHEEGWIHSPGAKYHQSP